MPRQDQPPNLKPRQDQPQLLGDYTVLSGYPASVSAVRILKSSSFMAYLLTFMAYV